MAGRIPDALLERLASEAAGEQPRVSTAVIESDGRRVAGELARTATLIQLACLLRDDRPVGPLPERLRQQLEALGRTVTDSGINPRER